jgi:hypothetical protein
VANKVELELAIGEIPDLDELVPTTRDDDRVGGVRGESDTRSPVSVALIFNGVFAFTKSVPQLDGLVSGSRNNLSVVSRESNTQDVLGVTDESSGGGSKVKIPETKSTVPRSRQAKLSIRRNCNILHEVGVASQNLTRDTILLFRFSGKVPDEDGLVS